MDTTEFEINDAVTVEGISADHVWYNADILTRNMASWGSDFQKLVGIMEARHKEHLKMIADLLAERTALKRELAALKSAPKEE
jgi:hypothetical protein